VHRFMFQVMNKTLAIFRVRGISPEAMSSYSFISLVRTSELEFEDGSLAGPGIILVRYFRVRLKERFNIEHSIKKSYPRDN